MFGWSLRGRLLWTWVAVAVAGTVASVWFVDRWYSESAAQHLGHRAEATVHLISGIVAPRLAAGQIGPSRTLSVVAEAQGALAIVILDPDGDVLAAEPANAAAVPFLSTRPDRPDAVVASDIEGVPVEAFFSPLPFGDEALGGVWVVFDRRSLAVEREHRRQAVLEIWVGVVAVGVLVALLSLGGLPRALGRVGEAVERLGRGESPVRTPTGGPQELRWLAARVEEASTRLASTRTSLDARIQELEKDLSRRSHEVDQVNRLLMDLANRDALTGLANRRRLEIDLERHLSLARRTGQPLAVIMIDLDRFKTYNDTVGHLAGDTLLRTVASALRARARATDLVVRWGGDEFCVLAPGTSSEGAIAAAEGLVEAIREATSELPLPDTGEIVGASAGVACFPDDAQEARQLVARADAALYLAKENGRGTVARLPAAPA